MNYCLWLVAPNLIHSFTANIEIKFLRFALRSVESGVLPSRHSLVHNQQWKHQNYVWKLFEATAKTTFRFQEMPRTLEHRASSSWPEWKLVCKYWHVFKIVSLLMHWYEIVRKKFDNKTCLTKLVDTDKV